MEVRLDFDNAVSGTLWRTVGSVALGTILALGILPYLLFLLLGLSALWPVMILFLAWIVFMIMDPLDFAGSVKARNRHLKTAVRDQKGYMFTGPHGAATRFPLEGTTLKLVIPRRKWAPSAYFLEVRDRSRRRIYYLGGSEAKARDVLAALTAPPAPPESQR